MTLNDKIKKEIVSLLKKQKVNIEIDDLASPPSQEMGDLAFPCFELAKKNKKNPADMAKELADKIKPAGLIINIKNIGPYLNFLFDYDKIAELVIKEITKAKGNYGQTNIGKKQRVMIEYSQLNTHKEFHVGHLRNVCIGSALINIYKTTGHKVIAANYVGDSGAHVAKTLWYYVNYINQTDIPADKGEFLGQLYTRAVAKLEEKPEFKNEVQDVLQSLENGEAKYDALWRKTRKWSMDQFSQFYKELGVTFNVYFYESVEEKAGKKMIDQLLKHSFIKKSQGAIIADLKKHDLDVLVLVRKDGTALYGIKDIPLAMKKFKKHRISKSIYIIDNRQSLYIKQVFKILNLLGFNQDMQHIPYEFVQLKSGIMSSRTGNVVTYKEVKEAALNKVITETKERHSDWSEKKVEQISLAIVLAALKFGMLKSNTNKVITFDLDEALDVNGFTGPYLQYTTARMNSILKKATKVKAEIDYSVFETNIEKELIKDLLNYSEVIESALKINDPSVLLQYVYKLAQDFNTFYHELPVIKAETNIMFARLALITSVKQVLENGMEVLNMPVLKEM